MTKCCTHYRQQNKQRGLALFCATGEVCDEILIRMYYMTVVITCEYGKSHALSFLLLYFSTDEREVKKHFQLLQCKAIAHGTQVNCSPFLVSSPSWPAVM